MKRLRPAQHGFAAIAAIFLVVVLAALGGFMLTFSNTQQLTSAQDVQGSRAYWAARAGLEWGVVQVLPAAAPCPPVANLNIEGFVVNVTCVLTAYVDAGAAVNVFRITSVARNGAVAGPMGYIERSVTSSVERGP